MNAKPTYVELAEAIARCVYDEMYLEEPYIDDNGEMGKKRTVDNMCSSSFQIPTGVLNRLEILEPLDTLARRNDFTCTPDKFKEKIAQNQPKGCSYDKLILALVCLLENYPNVKHVYNLLVRLDVCEPDTDPPYDKGENWPDKSTIRWTKKKKEIDKLYKNWTTLLET